MLAHDAERALGGLVHEDFVAGSVRLIAYLAIDPSIRARGLGTRLLRTSVGTAGDALVLAEVEDPRHWPTTAVSDPPARLRFWARTGARLVPVPYVQPSLQAGRDRVHHLLLLALPRPGPDPRDSVPGPLVAAFVREHVAQSEGSFDAHDPENAALLDACGPGDLPLSALDRLDVVP